MIILKRPIITEQSMKLTQVGLFTFEVDKAANKIQIAKVVSEKFKVDVVRVRTINVKPKAKSQRKVRKNYLVPGFKKALVQLKSGQKIALFETSIPEEPVVTTGEEEPIVKEKRGFLRGPKVKIEKAAPGGASTTQRKVITGK